MNLADLTAVLAAIIGFISPAAYSFSKNASWWVILACAVAGLVYGMIMAAFSGKIAYWILMFKGRTQRTENCMLIVYLLFPLPALSLTLFGAIGLTSLLVG